MAKNYELGNLVWKIKGEATDFDKNLKGSESKLTQFGTKLTGAGKKLTTFVTGPLALLGFGALKASSDLQESANAVSVVFGESADVIDKWGETADKNAGLSQSAFNSIATVIGAQLKQSGLEIDDVAEQTINLTQRAADLASVFNTEVTDAAGALGAALRGESEPARRFAINISDAAITAEALATGLVKSKKEMTDQIKVQARLNLIMKQSADVQGDFVNTSDSLANRTRILKSEIINVAAELGNSLVPIAEDVLGVVGDLVSGFADLDDGTKELILKLAFLAAATGPIALMTGNIIKAIPQIKSMSKVIRDLSLKVLASPVGIIALLGAATVALTLFTSAKRKQGLEELATRLSEVKDASALTKDEMESLSEVIIKEIGREGARGFVTVNDTITKMSQELNISRGKLIDVALEADNLKDSYKEQLLELQEQNKEHEKLKAIGDERLRGAIAIEDSRKAELKLIQDQKDAIEAVADAARIAEEIRLNGVIEGRKLATKNFQEDIDLIERKATLDLLTNEELIQAKISAEENFQNQLLEIGFDGLENAQGQLDIGDEQVLDSIERRKELVEELKEFELEAIDEINTTMMLSEDEIAVIRVRQAAREKERLQELRDDYAKTAEFYVGAFAGAFESVGQALVNQEDAWGALGKAALNTLAEIVRALGSQLVAEAAVLYAKAFFTAGATIPLAIAATAGAAVAFGAAGAISASAQNFQGGGFVQPLPGVSDRGDNVPASLNPREVVLTEDDAVELLTAIRSGSIGGITVNQYNTLNTDSDKNMQKAARQLQPYLTRERQRLG